MRGNEEKQTSLLCLVNVEERVPKNLPLRALKKMAEGITPVLDSVWPLDQYADGLARLEERKVFGKVLVTF